MILCSDHSLYTGITTDLARRFRQHGMGQGARYFRGRQPLRVVYQEACPDRSAASRREAAIKALSRADKERLVVGGKLVGLLAMVSRIKIC
jgi:putative endonuclease